MENTYASATCTRCNAQFPALQHLIDAGAVAVRMEGLTEAATARLVEERKRREASANSLGVSGPVAGGALAGALVAGPAGLLAGGALGYITKKEVLDVFNAIYDDEVRQAVARLTLADPHAHRRALVRQGGGLGPEEERFLARRRAYCRPHLAQLLAGHTPGGEQEQGLGSASTDFATTAAQGSGTHAPGRAKNDLEIALLPPEGLRIAVSGSGGGLRAMVAFSASLLALQHGGVLDATTYVAGLSGSTWTLGNWYSMVVELALGAADKVAAGAGEEAGVLLADTYRRGKENDSSDDAADGADPDGGGTMKATPNGKETAHDASCAGADGEAAPAGRPPTLGKAAAVASASSAAGTPVTPSPIHELGAQALEVLKFKLRGRINQDIRFPPSSWRSAPELKRLWVSERFAARVAAGHALTSTDLWGALLAHYFLGDTDPRGTTLSDQRAVLASGELPMPLYVAVKKVPAKEAAMWMRDDTSERCLVCGARFGAGVLYSRKHHCRCCGRLVCSKCSTHRVPVQQAADEALPSHAWDVRSASGADQGGAETPPPPEGPPVRICDGCWKSERFRETRRVAGAEAWEWWEFSPFEVAPLEELLEPVVSEETPPVAASAAVAATAAAPAVPTRDMGHHERFAGLGVGLACPTWAFGREFRDGVSLAVTPGGEPSLGLYLGVFGAAFCLTLDRALQAASPGLPSFIAAPLEALAQKHHGAHLFTPPGFQDPRASSRVDLDHTAVVYPEPSVVDEIFTVLGIQEVRKDKQQALEQEEPRSGAKGNRPGHGETSPSRLEGSPPACQPEERIAQELPLADAGFEFNFPLPPLLRQDRGVQVHIVFDFSAYDPKFTWSEEWAKLLAYCAEHRIPLPEFRHDILSSEACSVFLGNATRAEPTLIVFHLKAILGPTAATKDFSPLDNAAQGGFCGNTTPKYTRKEFDQLFTFAYQRTRENIGKVKDAVNAHLASMAATTTAPAPAVSTG
uniref:Lysophospholipase n=1 Tax=Rhizochromulina marina TaxID=1034831 RepID=A0A7S2SFB5_9STRA